MMDSTPTSTSIPTSSSISTSTSAMMSYNLPHSNVSTSMLNTIPSSTSASSFSSSSTTATSTSSSLSSSSSSSSAPSTSASTSTIPTFANILGRDEKDSTAKPVNFAEVRRKSTAAARRKNFDRELPEKFDLSFPESAIYSHLLALERRIDATLSRRMVDVQEALREPAHTLQTLRIMIWHEHEPIVPTDAAAVAGSIAPNFAWTLRIVGQFLDDSECAPGSIAGPPLRVLGNLLQTMTIQLDQHQYPGTEGLIEWHKHSSAAITDGFEIHRIGKGDIPLQITFNFDYTPRRYTLAPHLAKLLGIQEDTEPKILSALWAYIKQNNLMHPTDPTVIVPNTALAAAFLLTPTLAPVPPVASIPHPSSATSSTISSKPIYENISLSQLAVLLRPHLTTPDPHVIRYVIRTGSVSPSPITAYDISVPLPELPQAHSALALLTIPVPSATATTPTNQSSLPYTSKPRPAEIESIASRVHSLGRECADINDKISHIMDDLHTALRKREFLNAFSSAPVDTFQMLVSNQARKLLSKADASLALQQLSPEDRAAMEAGLENKSILSMQGEVERSRRSEYYTADWIADAVDRFVTSSESQTIKMTDD